MRASWSYHRPYRLLHLGICIDQISIHQIRFDHFVGCDCTNEPMSWYFSCECIRLAMQNVKIQVSSLEHFSYKQSNIHKQNDDNAKMKKKRNNQKSNWFLYWNMREKKLFANWQYIYRATCWCWCLSRSCFLECNHLSCKKKNQTC